MKLEEYDGIEVRPVHEDEFGHCEAGVPATKASFFSVYLHCKEGGVECIDDFNTVQEARAAAGILKKVLGFRIYVDDCDYGQSYWEEHPDHPSEDWKYEVSNGDTRQGYWSWVRSKIEQSRSDYCLKCGGYWSQHNDDGSCVDDWPRKRNPSGPGYTEDI